MTTMSTDATSLPDLTPKQTEVFKVIIEFRRGHGYSPTMKYIGQELLISKVTVFNHVRKIRCKGWVMKDASGYRNTVPTPAAIEFHVELKHNYNITQT